jgi:hypothetical protein
MTPHLLIKALADRSGLSTRQLAIEMDKASFQGTLYKLIHGQIETPTQPTAKKVAAYFDLPLEALYDRSVAQRIAVERQIEHLFPVGAREPKVIHHEKGAGKANVLPQQMLARISLLNKKQFKALQAMIDAYLDTVVPQEHVAPLSSKGKSA